MFWETLVVLLIGCAGGIGLSVTVVRGGLSNVEWLFLREFYKALRAGNYQLKEKDEDKDEC